MEKDFPGNEYLELIGASIYYSSDTVECLQIVSWIVVLLLVRVVMKIITFGIHSC
jgi:hypothetical protein